MQFEKQPCVYILASQRHGTLYVGVTSDLYTRVCAHRNGTFEGFTKKYNVKMLVWFEQHDTMDSAMRGGRRMKGGEGGWRGELVEEVSPVWRDLFSETFDV